MVKATLQHPNGTIIKFVSGASTMVIEKFELKPAKDPRFDTYKWTQRGVGYALARCFYRNYLRQGYRPI